MEQLFRYLGPFAMLAVVGVLLMGLWNMIRAGPSSRSQMLMRWRVGLQLLAIIILMTSLYLSNH